MSEPYSLPITPGTRCPRCRAVTDLVEDPSYRILKPKVGDVVVCTHCAGLLTLTNVGTLRELRDAEYRALSVPQLLTIADMQGEVARGRFKRGPSAPLIVN